jgi:hypothetical protein
LAWVPTRPYPQPTRAICWLPIIVRMIRALPVVPWRAWHRGCPRSRPFERRPEPFTCHGLLTNLAESARRAFQTAASDAAWREALPASPDTCPALDRGDFLPDQQRPRDARDLLRPAAASKAVLLRRVIVAERLGRPEAGALRREIVDGHAQAQAHKSSDARLFIDLQPARSTLRRHIALRDLDVTLSLHADGNRGKLGARSAPPGRASTRWHWPGWRGRAAVLPLPATRLSSATTVPRRCFN